MTLHDEVLRWQDGLKFGAIYRHGIDMGNGPEKGKRPDAGHQDAGGVTAKEAVQSLLDKPETYGAIGLFSGPDTGVVILDVDRNLYGLQRQHSELKELPHVTSMRENAAKYVFMVKEADRQRLKGGKIADDHGEILYSNKLQGVIYGAYKDEGNYSIHGDFSKIPELPDWLYDQMVPRTKAKVKKSGWGAIWDDVSRGRDQNRMAEILEQAIMAIPNTGLGGYDTWVMLGMACKSTNIPQAKQIFTNWSKRDKEYIDAGVWDDGADPCAAKWDEIDAEGGVTIGTIIQMADEHDPERARMGLSLDPRRNDEKDQFKADSYDEFLRRAKEFDKITNASKRTYLLEQLGMEYGYNRDPAAAVQELLLSALKEEVKHRKPDPTRWLIPDVLMTGIVSCWFGDPSSGKSKALLKFSQILCEGTPFKSRGKLVPVKPCRVLWLNNDQPRSDLERMAEDHGFDTNHPNFRVLSLWDFNQKWELVKEIEDFNPDFIPVDSLSACSSCPSDENKASYANDIQWLVMMNGFLWKDPKHFAVLHHMRKKGKGEKQGDNYRGSGLLEAKFQDMIKVCKDEKEPDSNRRLIVWQDKARTGKAGDVIVSTQDVHGDVLLEQLSRSSENATTAQTLIEAQLALIQASGSGMTAQELANDSKLQRLYGLRSTKDEAEMANFMKLLSKNVKRFVEKGLVEQNGTQPNAPGVRGPRQKVWKPVISRAGTAKKSGDNFEKPVVDREINNRQGRINNRQANNSEEAEEGAGINRHSGPEDAGGDYLFASDTNGSDKLSNSPRSIRRTGKFKTNFSWD